MKMKVLKEFLAENSSDHSSEHLMTVLDSSLVKNREQLIVVMFGSKELENYYLMVVVFD
jgi:hypothetical protein